GLAIGTEPPAGTKLKRGRTVTLFISKGPRVVEMPDVLGEQEDVAESRLEELRLVVNVETRHADEPEGTVIAQRPPPGTEVPRGETVTIVASTGRGSVIMPNVVGRSRRAAIDVLKSRDLSVDVAEQVTDQRSEHDRVLDQAPNPGTRLLKGDVVTIFVGAFGRPGEPPGGPPPPPTPPGGPPPPPPPGEPPPPPPPGIFPPPASEPG
ncbi:MAG: PASTA domain-containing protein, partial [Actinomycetota bacterium]